MKIIQISPHYPPKLGGAQLRVKELSEHLAKKGHQVGVFTSDIGCKKGKLKSKKNLKIHYLKSWEFAHTPIIPSLFWKLMKIPQDSIMHVHIAQAFVPEIVWLVSKIRRIPYIAHIRMNVEPSSLIGKFILKPYKKLFLKKVLENAQKMIVLNQDYFNLIQEKYNIPKNKIVVIPNATNFSILKNKEFSSRDKINLLAVGRLEQQKNYFNLIESISLLPSEIKENLVLNILGDGSQKKELTDFIKRLKLENNIFLRGKIEGRKLERVYKKSDLFILASFEEGFSTTLLEAMSKGLPIIASKVLGNSCVIKENYNGYFCNTNSSSIAKTIEKMIKNKKKWKFFSKNNLQEVKKYSWDKIVSQTEQVYREVLKEHHKNAHNKK